MLFPSSHYCGQCSTCLKIKKIYLLEYVKTLPIRLGKDQYIIHVQTRHKLVYYLVRLYCAWAGCIIITDMEFNPHDY